MTNEHQNFFSVACDFLLLADPIEPEFKLVDDDALIAMMPSAFQLMAQVNQVEQRVLPLMSNLKQETAELAEYLNLQNRKIDLVLQMQLANSLEAHYRCKGVSFGGSGVKVSHQQAIEVGTVLEIKLLVSEENIAVYAIAEVIDCQQVENRYHWHLDFTSISDGDQEQLVHASLQVEQRHLRARAAARRQQAD